VKLPEEGYELRLWPCSSAGCNTWVPNLIPLPMLTTGLPAMAPATPDDGTWLVDALVAVDRLVVAIGLLVLVGGAGFVAVARLPQAASRIIRRLERRTWWLLRAAWWATLLGTLAGLLLHGPFTIGVPLSRSLDARLLDQTLRTRFGAVWVVRVLLLLSLALLPVWSPQQATRMRTSAWWAVAALAAALVVTPALSGHAAASPDAAVGLVVGVLHFSAVAVWFGSLMLLGTCVLPRPDVRLLQALPRFSSVAFTAMVVIVVTGIAQSWRQLGSLQALGHTTYGRLLVGKVAVFLLLIAVAGYSRAVVRRKLTARALVGAAASPHQPAGAPGPARLSNDADTRSIWLLRRLVLAEIAIALLVLAITALLGITTPPRAT
jgi:copper transport protein